MKKYSKWLIIFVMATVMVCLEGCANYYDDDGVRSSSETTAQKPDMESTNEEEKESPKKDSEDDSGNEVVTIKIGASDKPVRLEEELEGNDEVEKLTIVIDTKATEEKVLDYEYLQNLEQLSALTIHDGQLKDISFLSGLEQLNLLDLKECAISNVEPIAELDRLLYLYLSGNEIYDVSALSGMNLVSELDLSDNPLSDPAQLGNLIKRLQSLNLDNTGTLDIGFLAGARYLKKLSLKNNLIMDFEALKESEHLMELDISGNPIENPDIFLYVPNTVFYEPADCDREPYKSEIEKAFLQFNPMEQQENGSGVRVDNCSIGDFNGDGIDDLGVVVWWWDFYEDIDERRFYLYPGNGTGYDNPLQPLALGERPYRLPEESIVMHEGRAYFYCRQLLGQEQNTIIRVVSYQEGAWECEIYSNSSLYTCYPGEEEAWSQELEKTNLVTFETADFISDEYQEYFYIDEDMTTGYFEKYLIKKNRLSICVRREEAEGESNLPVIVDFYPELPDFSLKTAGFRLEEKSEGELEPPNGVLERILEEYYPGCEAHEIFYDIECLENMERLLGVMLPEYFYGIETEGGTIYLILEEKTYRYIYTAYLNGEICGEYIYNPVKDVLMEKEEYENQEYAW